MKIKRSDYETQTDFLNALSNKTGNPEMKICMSGKTPEGDIWFSRRYSILELNSIHPNDNVYLNHKETSWISRKDFMEKATHRTILDIEFVFDCDDEPILQTAKFIMKRYASNKPVCYFTGSKSYHIHLLKPELKFDKELQELRSKLLSKRNCDAGKGSSRNMIAIEGALHYKSGKPKIEVDL